MVNLTLKLHKFLIVVSRVSTYLHATKTLKITSNKNKYFSKLYTIQKI